MDVMDFRLECLKLADAAAGNDDPKAVIDRARAYADFVWGAKDAKVLGAARDLAKAIAQSDGS